mmetsp:Transcript_37175/g.83328  ORF Transcript_37175/g.83328 Transcript_37175/m.83328 type:complete len:127 (+) Transcript_37175:592-972(+)
MSNCGSAIASPSNPATTLGQGRSLPEEEAASPKPPGPPLGPTLGGGEETEAGGAEEANPDRPGFFLSVFLALTRLFSSTYTSVAKPNKTTQIPAVKPGISMGLASPGELHCNLAGQLRGWALPRGQ